jgi:hypothetical protein
MASMLGSGLGMLMGYLYDSMQSGTPQQQTGSQRAIGTINGVLSGTAQPAQQQVRTQSIRDMRQKFAELIPETSQIYNGMLQAVGGNQARAMRYIGMFGDYIKNEEGGGQEPQQ